MNPEAIIDTAQRVVFLLPTASVVRERLAGLVEAPSPAPGTGEDSSPGRLLAILKALDDTRESLVSQPVHSPRMVAVLHTLNHLFVFAGDKAR